MKVSSRTPVKVKRRSCIVWMMDPASERRGMGGLDGDSRKKEPIIDGNHVASSVKRSFSDENLVQDHDATVSQQKKKAKVDAEERTLKPDDQTLSPQANKSSVHSNSSAIQQKDGSVMRSISKISKKICSSLGCGRKSDHQKEWCPSSSASSSSCTIALGSSNSSRSSSDDGVTPKIYFYSRHTTWRLRNSSPNQHSPLIARRLRF
jgi:hypothetical protein